MKGADFSELGSCCHRNATNRSDHSPRTDATRARPNGLSGAFDVCFHSLQIGQPTSAGLGVRVRNFIAGDGLFAAVITCACHRRANLWDPLLICKINDRFNTWVGFQVLCWACF